MEAQAPTPSPTPYIIDYARLQISLEGEEKKNKGTERQRVRDAEVSPD